MHMFAGTGEGQKGRHWITGIGVEGACEPPDMGVVSKL